MALEPASRIGDLSGGDDGFPPSPMITTPASKTFINDKAAGVVGAIFAPHTKGKTTHAHGLRKVITGASNTFFEGKAAARRSDVIADGDTIAQGSPNTYIASTEDDLFLDGSWVPDGKYVMVGKRKTDVPV